MRRQIQTLALVLAVLATSLPARASAQATLDEVRERGYLRCQIGSQQKGFYELENGTRWIGFDVDICRAIAAAIFGDPDRVAFQSVTAGARFSELVDRQSDVLSRTTTWTLSRDVGLGVNFTATTFYDGQGFIFQSANLAPDDAPEIADSPSSSCGAESPKERLDALARRLADKTVCVLAGTTTEDNLRDFGREKSIDIEVASYEDSVSRNVAYRNGECNVLTDDMSSLAAIEAGIPRSERKNHFRPRVMISKEPLGPVVREGDDEWRNVVRWVVYAMIAAEELGISSDEADDSPKGPGKLEARRLLGLDDGPFENFRLERDWAASIVRHVGNYGEVYDRNVGFLERACTPNALWNASSDGQPVHSPPYSGLMYAPPIR